MTVVHRAVYLRQGSASGDIGVSHANLLVSVEGRQMVPASTGEGTWNCAMSVAEMARYKRRCSRNWRASVNQLRSWQWHIGVWRPSEHVTYA